MNLRKLEQKDAPFMLEWMHDTSVVENLQADFASKTMDDCYAFIMSAQNATKDLHLAIVDESDIYMGTVSLRHITKSDAEFAITVRRSAMGKGFSKYGMDEIIRIGLEDMGLERIYWCVAPENKRAVRFYDKNNYCRIENQSLPRIPEGTYNKEQIDRYIWYSVARVNYPRISVVIPVRNEEKYIEQCINSILEQTYPKDKMQLIFVDGMSEDDTRKIIEKYVNAYPQLIRLIDNPEKIVPIAMNLGIEQADGEYLVRLDAHSDYQKDYLQRCIATIQEISDADNVGGLAITKGNGKTGEAYAQVLSSKFGVGNSGFRTNAKSGYVDTVPFGTFRRSVFEKYGKYNESLKRNQDNEMNYRIRKNGGKIYLNSDIKFWYYCRDTLKGILKQGFENGKWNIITMRLCPGSMGLRHFVPFAFVLSIVFLGFGSLFLSFVRWLFASEIILYLLLDFIFSIKNAEPRYKNHFLYKLILFPMFHISYGIGSMAAVFGMH